MGGNKRKTSRLSCIVPVEAKEGSEFEQVKTVDISRAGLGFVSKRKIPIDKEIPIELDFAHEEDPVFVLGKVKWVQPIQESTNYRIGVIFKEIMFGSKTRLHRQFRKRVTI